MKILIISSLIASSFALSNASAAPTVTGIAGCVLGNAQTVSQKNESSRSYGGGGSDNSSRDEGTITSIKYAVGCTNTALAGQNVQVDYYSKDSNRKNATWSKQNEVNPYTYGSYVTANEINNAFSEMEKLTYEKIVREIETNKQTIVIKDTINTSSTIKGDGRIYGNTAQYFGTISQKSISNAKNPSFDLTDMRKAFE